MKTNTDLFEKVPVPKAVPSLGFSTLFFES